MKYADKVIELMAAYPGREFRMMEIVKYVNPKPDKVERHKLRIGVARVIAGLIETGSVLTKPPAAKRGGFALYRWRA